MLDREIPNGFDEEEDDGAGLYGGRSSRELHDKPLSVLLDIAVAQMKKGKHTPSIPIEVTLTETKDGETNITKVGGGEIDDDAYSTHMMYCQIHGRLGETLAAYPDNGAVAGLSERFKGLMQEAVRCEQEVEAKNKLLRDDIRGSRLELFLTTREYSRENHAHILILEGYQNPKVEDVEKQIKNIYEMLADRETLVLSEFDAAVDGFVRNVGRLIRRNQDDSLAWQLDLVSSIVYTLNDQVVNYWTSDLDSESQDRGVLEQNQRKLWVVHEVLDGYLKVKYGGDSHIAQIPDQAKAQQEAIIASRFNPALESKLKENSKTRRPTGHVMELVPGILDRYLLTLGIERGKHYDLDKF
jgi:hypothetical protein